MKPACRVQPMTPSTAFARCPRGQKGPGAMARAAPASRRSETRTGRQLLDRPNCVSSQRDRHSVLASIRARDKSFLVQAHDDLSATEGERVERRFDDELMPLAAERGS